MLSVLIVDDESYVCEGIERNIPWSRFGIGAVYQAHTGREGLALAERLRPDIVISDVRMPHMNGLDMASALQTQYPKVRLIFMSAYSELAYYKKAIKLHAVSFIEKPIILEELIEEIRHAAEQIASERSATYVSKAELEKYALTELLHCSKAAAAQRLLREVPFHNGFSLFIAGRIAEPLPGELEAARRKLQSLTGPYVRIWSTYDGQCTVFLLSSGSLTSGQLWDIGESLLRLKESDAAYVTAAACERPEQIPAIYKQASERQAYGFFHDHAFVDLSMILPETKQKAPSDEEQALSRIQRAVVEVDFPALYRLSDRYLSALMSTDSLSPDQVRSSALKLLSVVRNGFRAIGNPARAAYRWETLKPIDSFSRLKAFCIEQITAMCDEHKLLHEKGRSVYLIRQAIEQNYSVPRFSISSLASQMHFSESHLSSQFKRQYHMTIGEYINQVRMEKAKELLLDPSVRVSDVAVQVGFDNTDYFTKRFRQYTGKTPSEYRR